MTVLKTRAKLVDVARQLFAKKGVEATTMNDIAVASKKGRRTLYGCGRVGTQDAFGYNG